MKKALTALQTTPLVTEREWTVEGIPVLTASVSLPQPAADRDRIARRIRRYYQLQRRSFLRYCETSLLPWASAEYRAALASSAPLPRFQAELTYCVTYDQQGFWSLYTQSRERTLPGQTLLTRRGDTWDLHTGYPVPLADFFPRHAHWRKYLLSLAASQIRQQEDAGIARYREDWPQRLKHSFNARDFYLTQKGLIFFYPMYTLGPAAEGIPVFLAPYGQEGLRDLTPAAP